MKTATNGEVLEMIVNLIWFLRYPIAIGVGFYIGYLEVYS